MTFTFPQPVQDVLDATIARHAYPLLFVTVSGAHLYGFASPDSDVDLRGAHVLPPRELLGLDAGPDTITEMIDEDVEVDLVTHDAVKFFRMLLQRNGYVLEQLLSPIVLRSSPAHEELVALAPLCFTRFHAHHYLGFAANQWTLFSRESPPRVKPLLYTFRVLLTGIHLMRSGRLEANLRNLNEEARLPYVEELIARKSTGSERGTLDDAELGFYQREYERLIAELEAARDATTLPEQPAARAALHDLLLRVRGL